jgi:hypothetical protein
VAHRHRCTRGAAPGGEVGGRVNIVPPSGKFQNTWYKNAIKPEIEGTPPGNFIWKPWPPWGFLQKHQVPLPWFSTRVHLCRQGGGGLIPGNSKYPQKNLAKTTRTVFLWMSEQTIHFIFVEIKLNASVWSSLHLDCYKNILDKNHDSLSQWQDTKLFLPFNSN